MKIILASRSPRRKRILRELGLDISVIPSDADESNINEELPRELVRKLAILKAGSISNGMREYALVIGADTVVVLNNEVLGKPISNRERAGMLEKLSGKEHSVYTGICIVNTQTGKVFTDVSRTKVRFRNLTKKEIEKTIQLDGSNDAAGGYKIQDQPWLIDRIDGSYTNVMGLPTEKIIPLLRENGIDI